MRKSSSDNTLKPSANLVKTCNVCFKAKIRCDRSNKTGPCDRCLRLGKECVFAPRRQYNSDASLRLTKRVKTGHNDLVEDNSRPSLPTDDQPGVGRASDANAPFLRPESRSSFRAVTTVEAGGSLARVQEWLDEEKQGQLFDLFRFRLSPRFPFVIVPESMKPEDMRQQRPHTYLAILAIASSKDFVLQRKLSELLNLVVTANLAAGKLASLDMLQGLLLHLAWYVSLQNLVPVYIY